MSVSKIWQIKNTVVTDEQLTACDNNKILAALLKNRNIENPNQIKAFLNPLKTELTSPDVFSDMVKVINRIKDAITNSEHITVFGDFDADGITSTALLYLTLKEIGADVDYYLPDRETESHGLNTKALVKIIAKRKSKLIITVDCGITNINEINFAKGFNTDIIITDHHEAPETLPNAFAILNPKAQNSLKANLSLPELTSLNYLAGVGVAFKLACKLLETYNKENFVNEILPLAAIGTIGDVVELLGENRSIVAMGIELIKAGKHKGIQKLLESMGIHDIKTIHSDTIAYGIVPRLNAAGRLESPNTAFNILASNDEKIISNTIKTLNDLNSLRQTLCEETFNEAENMYKNNIFSNKKSIILFSENWHIGIIGIVSSKLLEKYNKPVLLMTRDANIPNIIRCSSRSIEQINIYEVLSKHKEYFEGFGGHKMAAGFSFDENKIKFEDIKKKINSTIEEVSHDVDFSVISVTADLELEPENINTELLDTINLLQPFGAANPMPLFVMKHLTLKQLRTMGQNNNHLKLFVSKNNSPNIECVKWNYTLNIPENSDIDILFTPQINEFNGNKTVQLILDDIHSEFIKKEEPVIQYKILDHRQKKDILNQVLDFIMSTKKKTAIYLKSPKLKKEIEHCTKATEIIIDENNVSDSTEQLMLFESPKSIEEFTRIINNSNPQIIHLMNFNNQEIIIDKYILTFSGMLKYALSNLDGVLEVDKLKNALSVDEEIINDTLNLFDELGMINLNQSSENEYKITYLKPLELSKIKQNELYDIIEEKICEINKFKNFYSNSSIEEIKALL